MKGPLTVALALYVKLGGALFHLWTCLILGSGFGAWAGILGFFFPVAAELTVAWNVFQAVGIWHPYVLGFLSFPAAWIVLLALVEE
jgi:hypothetical protein